MIAPFQLHQPDSLPAALSLLRDLDGETKILAGGSELLLLLKMGLTSTNHIIDIKKIPHLDQVEVTGDRKQLILGPLVTHRTIERSPLVRRHLPLFSELESQVANVRVRNVGTLAGNLCFAEPHADPGTLLITYNAIVKLQNASGERMVAVDEFFTDFYETVLEKDELLTEIQIPILAGNFRGAYLRFCPGERPMAGVALLLGWKDGICDDARVGLGCMGPKPIRLAEAEEWLVGKAGDEIISKTGDVGTIAARMCDPVEDIWGSADYKRHIVHTLIGRGLTQVCQEEQSR